MTISLFVLVSAINIALLLFLIHKRGWVSIEGLCAIYLLVAIVSDNVEILIRAHFWPETLLLGPDEINLRIYPTIVHILGIGALLAGLTLADPRPRPMSRTLVPSEARLLIRIGIALVLIGAVMFGVALHRGVPTGFTTTAGHKEVVERQGAFLYRGAEVALLGLALLFTMLRGSPRVLVGVAVLAVPIVALFNKGGLEKGLIYAAVAFSVYQSTQFAKVFRSGFTWTIGIPTVLLLIVLVIGVKGYYRRGKDVVGPSDALLAGLNSLQGRYSADGLYRGYSQMTTYMRNGWAEPFDGRMITYALTSWIPGAIYSDKPAHPTRNTGYMIYSDHHSYKGDASAYTLVGIAYADFGLASVFSYLLIGGIILGLVRKAANRIGGSLYHHVGYLFLCVFNACSAESGLLLTIYISMLCAGVVALTWIVVHLLFAETRLEYRTWRPSTRYQSSSTAGGHATRRLRHVDANRAGLSPSSPGE